MKLNDIIHQQVRLRIMAALAAIEHDASIDFSYLKKQLELTDGNLGAHLAKLENANYISVQKHFVAKKPRTDLQLTTSGRAAFEEHMAVLRSIIGD